MAGKTKWRGTYPMLAALALLFLACPPDRAFEILSNTGGDLIVELVEGTIAWDVGSVLVVGEGGEVSWNELQWRQQESGRVPLLKIRRGSERLIYPLFGVPLSPLFVDSRGHTTKVKLQLERDGRVYAVKVNEPMPTRSHEAQPEGFPVAPERLSGSG